MECLDEQERFRNGNLPRELAAIALDTYAEEYASDAPQPAPSKE